MTADKRKSWGIPVAALLLAVPILYVLSVGPYFRYSIGSQEDDVTVSRFQVIYAPIDMICLRSSRMADALTWYSRVWLPPKSGFPAYVDEDEGVGIWYPFEPVIPDLHAPPAIEEFLNETGDL